MQTVSEKVVIEPATEADLDELSEMLGELFSQESDFRPNKDRQLRGLRLIFEQPSRGRVFVLRRDGVIVGMINLLFTISTAEGGFVVLLEDLVIHKEFQGHGYGAMLLKHAIEFARQKNFLRITLLTDRPENMAQEFFRRHGFHESSMIPMRLLISAEPDQPQSNR
jgi:GNAT superfamily N-acetyltransferase